MDAVVRFRPGPGPPLPLGGPGTLVARWWPGEDAGAPGDHPVHATDEDDGVGRWRTERGAIAAEQVAVVAVVAVVIAALWATEAPRRIGEHGAYAVCTLFGGDTTCTPPGEASSAPEVDPNAPPVCTTGRSESDRRTTTDLLFDRNVSGERFVTIENSDGSVTLIDTEYEGSGVVVGAGAELPLSAKDTLGISGTASGVLIEGVGLVYDLDEEAFEAYRDTVARQAVDAYMYGSPELHGWSAALGADTPEEALEALSAADQVRRILDAQVESHATHDLYSTTGEVSLDLGASWKLLNGSVGVNGSAGSTVHVHRETGAYDVTVALNGEASSGVGAGVFGLGASASESDGFGGTITLSYDADGELSNASMTVSYEAGTDGYVGFDLAGLVGAPPGSNAGYGFDLASGSIVQTTFDLPLEDAEDLNGLEDLLRDPVGSARSAFEAAAADGSVLVQTYDVEETSANVGLAVRMVASLGISGSDTVRQISLTDAFSYDPHNGFMHRTDCVG